MTFFIPTCSGIFVKNFHFFSHFFVTNLINFSRILDNFLFTKPSQTRTNSTQISTHPSQTRTNFGSTFWSTFGSRILRRTEGTQLFVISSFGSTFCHFRVVRREEKLQPRREKVDEVLLANRASGRTNFGSVSVNFSAQFWRRDCKVYPATGARRPRPGERVLGPNFGLVFGCRREG